MGSYVARHRVTLGTYCKKKSCLWYVGGSQIPIGGGGGGGGGDGGDGEGGGGGGEGGIGGGGDGGMGGDGLGLTSGGDGGSGDGGGSMATKRSRQGLTAHQKFKAWVS